MMAQYCGYAAYRKICCQSCQSFLSSEQGRGIGRSTFERPETVAIFSAEQLNMTGLYQSSISNQVNELEMSNQDVFFVLYFWFISLFLRNTENYN